MTQALPALAPTSCPLDCDDCTISHIWCGECEMSLCGVDLSGVEECPKERCDCTHCVVCDDLMPRVKACEFCGATWEPWAS